MTHSSWDKAAVFVMVEACGPHVPCACSMNLMRSIDDLSRLQQPVVLAFGMFDGVHRGHQAVLQRAQQAAADCGGVPLVFTFDPHPIRVLRPSSAPKLLCSTDHELLLLERAGLDAVLLCPFDAELAALSADDFIRKIHAACANLVAICVGEAWLFGKARSGNVEVLRRLGAEMGFSVHAVPSVTDGENTVSSTLVRQAVEAGDLALAERYLGRCYGVYGKVIHGDQLARTLGFPTANIAVENEQLPPAGVYAVRVRLDGRSLTGVANLGKRPTVTPANQDLSLEVHLFDFSEDLYGKAMEVDFVGPRLREEIPFPGLEALKAQIAKDCATAQAVLGAG